MNNNNNIKPIVAIVGRPNVGKSTLFNKIIGWSKAIVEDIPGVTRDRNYADADWGGVLFTLVDTGGFESESDDDYFTMIRAQVEIALEEADLILFMMDSTSGVMPQDEDLFKVIRNSQKPVLYVVNKVDHVKHEVRTYDFHSLGIDKFHSVSAEQGRNVAELLDDIVELLPSAPAWDMKDDEDNVIKIAVLGRPNVGKSTLINTILGEQRLLTSSVPGTTRDAIDLTVEKDGKKYVFIDTAGIRKKAKVKESVEIYSVLRSIRTIERSDVILLLIDGPDGPTHQEARLAELISKRGKASIIVINKWDLVPDDVDQGKEIEEIVKGDLHAIVYSPVITISALTGKKVHKLFPLIDEVYENYTRRLTTNSLNRYLQKTVQRHPPPLYRGKETKFYFVTQTKSKPPTIVFFTNFYKSISESYKRYLSNRLRDTFELKGTAVPFIFRARREK